MRFTVNEFVFGALWQSLPSSNERQRLWMFQRTSQTFLVTARSDRGARRDLVWHLDSGSPFSRKSSRGEYVNINCQNLPFQKRSNIIVVMNFASIILIFKDRFRSMKMTSSSLHPDIYLPNQSSSPIRPGWHATMVPLEFMCDGSMWWQRFQFETGSPFSNRQWYHHLPEEA